MSETQQAQANVHPGFDTSEPKARAIAMFGLLVVIAVIAVILGLQAYVDRVRERQVFVKQLEPVSADLRALRAQEDEQLNSYRYIDRAAGAVRIPIRRAMELLIAEKGGRNAAKN